jgi:signal transduction histidine kinase
VTRKILRSLFQTVWQQPLWAIPFALFFGLLNGSSWRGYVVSYEVSLVFAFVIRLTLVLFTYTLLPRVQARIRDGRLEAWAEAAGYGIFSIVGSYIASAIVHFTLLPGFLGSLRGFLISGVFAALFTSLIGGFFVARQFYRQAVDRARAVEQARAELAQAELRALRAQINPHFLFNTLNTIAALIAENPSAAEETTTRLAEVFRYALQASEREYARLGDELTFLRAYLDIERTRFGERLRVVERIEPGLDSVMVPSLLLQPVVENAVRHGIAPRPDGGTLTLSIRRDGHLLQVEVADDGPGIDDDAPVSGTGFGLHSVRERVRAAGPPHAIEIESSPAHGTRVRLTVPTTLPSLPAPSPSSRGVC